MMCAVYRFTLFIHIYTLASDNFSPSDSRVVNNPRHHRQHALSLARRVEFPRRTLAVIFFLYFAHTYVHIPTRRIKCKFPHFYRSCAFVCEKLCVYQNIYNTTAAFRFIYSTISSRICCFYFIFCAVVHSVSPDTCIRPTEHTMYICIYVGTYTDKYPRSVYNIAHT